MTIELRRLTKAYGEKTVLQDLTHSFPLGRTSCIMGPSGCGKTTLLRLMMGLEVPKSGEITGLIGLRFSAVFQEDRLCGELSALSNLWLVNPKLPRAEAQKALAALGLSDLSLPVGEFSGGMKRRTAILRALLAPYDVLFADEPFRGLDDLMKRRVMDYFKERTAGKTVLLVTHDKGEADFFSGGFSSSQMGDLMLY